MEESRARYLDIMRPPRRRAVARAAHRAHRAHAAGSAGDDPSGEPGVSDCLAGSVGEEGGGAVDETHLMRD
jgi:hypothetical protein